MFQDEEDSASPRKKKQNIAKKKKKDEMIEGNIGQTVFVLAGGGKDIDARCRIIEGRKRSVFPHQLLSALVVENRSLSVGLLLLFPSELLPVVDTCHHGALELRFTLL